MMLLADFLNSKNWYLEFPVDERKDNKYPKYKDNRNETINKWKRQSMNWEKIFANKEMNKGVSSNI